MAFPQATIARLESAVYDRLGEFAQWQGVADPVRVRRPRDGDQEFRLQYGELLVDAAIITVRQSEVAEPQDGDQVQILDDDGNAIAELLFAVAGEPKLDRKKGVWICQAKPAA